MHIVDKKTLVSKMASTRADALAKIDELRPFVQSILTEVNETDPLFNPKELYRYDTLQLSGLIKGYLSRENNVFDQESEKGEIDLALSTLHLYVGLVDVFIYSSASQIIAKYTE